MGRTNFPNGITDGGQAEARVTEKVTLAEGAATVATGLDAVTGAVVTLHAVEKGEGKPFTASATPGEAAGDVDITVLDVAGDAASGEVTVTVVAYGTDG